MHRFRQFVRSHSSTAPLVVAALAAVVLDAGVAQANADGGASRTERVQMVAAGWITAAYLFATGATIGSFLNVVIYRLPRGQNLRRPKSRCPQCHTQLRWYDNLPVVGWLLVGGRCRYCRAAISPRYPLIEAVCGGWFLALGYRELLSGGASLPLRVVPRMTGALWIIWSPQWELIGIYVYHLAQSCWLLVLMAWKCDRKRVPERAPWWLVVMGMLPAAVWPNLRPVGACGETITISNVGYLAEALRASNWTSGCVDGVCGLVVGAILGTALARAVAARHSTLPNDLHVLAVFIAAGLFLGWQAVLLVGAVAAVVALVVTAASGACPHSVRAALTYSAGLGALVFVTQWRLAAEVLPWLSRGPSLGAAFTAVLIVVVTATCRALAQRRPVPRV